MRRKIRLMILPIVLWRVIPAMAQDGPVSTPVSPDMPADLRAPQVTDETHPLYSTDGRWVVSMIIASAGLVLAAAVIGPMVRSNVPDAVPEAMSHEEDPAADRH